jgi:hypothetical protein
MSKKINKYLYFFVVQGKYTNYYGWEDLCQSENRKESRGNLKDYRLNDTFAMGLRMINRRELNPEYKTQ